MPCTKNATVEDRSYAKSLKAKARMTGLEELRELHRLLGKYEENRFRRFQAGLAEKVGIVRELVEEDVRALEGQGLSEDERRRILQE